MDLLSNSTVLGVDCEWEPKFEASFGLGVDSSPTSILQVIPANSRPSDPTYGLKAPSGCKLLQGQTPGLPVQVASRTEVVIFDLYKLHSSPILDKALTAVLWDEHTLKLGCGVGSDMKSAAKSYPHMAAFKKVRGVVDLRNLFLQHVRVTGLQVCLFSHLSELLNGTRWVPEALSGMHQSPVMMMEDSGLQLPRPCQEKNISLSMMAEACLGRPLDKSMQVSR